MIDWTKPICLDTVPPRMAQVVDGGDKTFHKYGICKSVSADWDGKGDAWQVWTDGVGLPPYCSDLPTVRNVRPGDFPETDIAAELAEALRAARDGLTFPAPSIGAVVRMIDAALAKWEASQ